MFTQFMQICRKSRYALSALILTMLLSESVCAKLRLELSASKTDYLLHEPLYITVKMKNPGSTDAYFINQLDPMWPMFHLFVTPPGEKTRPYGNTIEADWIYNSSDKEKIGTCLRPGYEISNTINISDEMAGADPTTLLRKPGEYLIQAVYERPAEIPCGPLRVKSNVLRLTVSKPQGKDFLAFNVIMTERKKVKKYLFWNHDKTSTNCYETIIHKYPESGYSKYAAYSLAGIHTMPSILNPESVESRIELEKAVDIYRSILDDTRGTEFGVQVAFLAARAAARTGMYDEAACIREEAFTSPASTINDKNKILSEMKLLEDKKLEGDRETFLVSLSKYAGALGFSVNWDPDTRTATVIHKGVQAKLYPDKGLIEINGKEYASGDMIVRSDDCKVDHTVITALMASQYKISLENILKAPPTQ